MIHVRTGEGGESIPVIQIHRISGEALANIPSVDSISQVAGGDGQRYSIPAAATFEVGGGKICRVTSYYNRRGWLAAIS